MMRKTFTILLFAALAWAAWGQTARPYLRMSEMPDAVRFLPPPPAEGSADFEADKVNLMFSVGVSVANADDRPQMYTRSMEK